jgi:HK97 family phage major capsid protein
VRTKTEKELVATEQLLEERADEAEKILQKARDEDRDPSEQEMEKITEIQKDIGNLRTRREDLKSLVEVQDEVRSRGKTVDASGNGAGEVSVEAAVRYEPPKSLGEQFTESKAYTELMEKGLQGQWSTGTVELDTKATLTTAPGTALTPAIYQPGVVETLYQPPTIASLMPSAPVAGPVVRYVKETSASVVNAAAGVAEAAAKPESTLVFEEVQDNVRKIATVLPVSEEMLADSAMIQGYINNRLSLFVQLEEDDQLLNGSAANDVSGLYGRSGVTTWARGTVDNQAEAIFKAANGQRGSSFLNPDGVILNPADWQTIRLLEDSNGQLYGGGPYYGPYGGPQGPSSANRFSADAIWGLRVVVTSAIGAGTALVGAFGQAAQVFRRSGINVEASNSHSDYFTKNLVAIRAEERLALAVYRPNAFTKVTGL